MLDIIFHNLFYILLNLFIFENKLSVFSEYNLVEQAFEKLNSITKFDKLSGYFITHNNCNDIIIIPDDIITNSKINVKDLKCCVCLEQTFNNTNCNHNLCLACWSNIKEVQCEENSDHTYKACPMCRQELFLN